MKRLLIAVSAVLALSFVGSSDASAQHYGCNSGYGGGYSSGYGGYYGGYGGGYSSPRLSVSVGYGNYGGYAAQNYGNAVYNSGYGGNHGYGGYSTWHDTSHLDYHAPSLVPHRGHYDYVPGHYDVHRTGHWDRHGH
jgi:hypothetical protein